MHEIGAYLSSFRSAVRDMLVMNPTLGVFARHIEPDGGGCGTCPIDRRADRPEIEVRKVRARSVASHAGELAEQSWAAVVVPTLGQAAHIIAEEVKREIMDRPARAGGR